MSKAGYAIVTSSVCNGIATICVILRLFSRFVILKRSWTDDYLIIASAALSWTLTALIVAQTEHGMGKHIDSLKPGEFEKMSKPFWASVAFYNLGLTVTKLSVLFQFLRFFITRSSRLACWTLTYIVGVYGIIIFVTSICSCMPIEYNWDKSIEGGKCINLLAFWYTNATFNIITDFAVIGLPIYVLKELHLPTQQKWALLGVFALGGFSCVTSILRLHSIYIVANSVDITWDNVNAATWSAIELNTAIMCACLPALKPLIQRMAPRLHLLSDGSRVGKAAGVSASASDGKTIQNLCRVESTELEQERDCDSEVGIERDCASPL